MSRSRLRTCTTGLAATLACTPLLAAPYHPSGANLAYGEISHTQGVMGSIANPASGVAMPPGFRFGLLGSVGLGYELGEEDDFLDAYETWGDESERLEAEIEEFQNPGSIEGEGDVDELLQTVETLTEVEEAGNTLLQAMNDDVALQLTGGLHVPPGPLVANHAVLGGALSLDVQGSFSGRAGVVADGAFETGLAEMPLRRGDWEPDGSGDAFTATGSDGIEWTIEEDGTVKRDGDAIDGEELSADDLSIYSDVEAAAIGRFSLGYSAQAYSSRDGSLYVGGRGHYYQAEMARVVTDLEGEDDAGETISDGYSEDRNSETAFGVDLGLLWGAQNYQLGLTGRNLNEPSFDYPAVANYDELPGAVQERVPRTKTYTLERQGAVEASLHSPGRRWMLGLSHDLNSVEGPHGAEKNNEYQWTAVGLGYASESYLWPGFRVGYRTNNAGSELSYITGGLTLFRVLNIDAAVSTDEVEHDGSSAPRSALINVGLEIGF